MVEHQAPNQEVLGFNSHTGHCFVSLGKTHYSWGILSMGIITPKFFLMLQTFYIIIDELLTSL